MPTGVKSSPKTAVDRKQSPSSATTTTATAALGSRVQNKNFHAKLAPLGTSASAITEAATAYVQEHETFVMSVLNKRLDMTDTQHAIELSEFKKDVFNRMDAMTETLYALDSMNRRLHLLEQGQAAIHEMLQTLTSAVLRQQTVSERNSRRSRFDTLAPPSPSTERHHNRPSAPMPGNRSPRPFLIGAEPSRATLAQKAAAALTVSSSGDPFSGESGGCGGGGASVARAGEEEDRGEGMNDGTDIDQSEPPVLTLPFPATPPQSKAEEPRLFSRESKARALSLPLNPVGMTPALVQSSSSSSESSSAAANADSQTTTPSAPTRSLNPEPFPGRD